MPKQNAHDFDRFFAAQKAEPLMFRLFGTEHALPPSLPAGVALRLIRAQMDGSESLPDADVMAAAEDLLGAERLRDWTRRGLTLDQLAEIIRWAMEQYTLRAQESAAGNEKAPQPE